jgi:hypothetical protein
VVNFKPRPLYPLGTRYSLIKRVSGPARRLDVLATSGNRTLDRPARSLVAISTRLLRLRFIIAN